MVGRPELLAARPDLEKIYRAADALFPVRITRSFASRADLTDPKDPLGLQVLPDARELELDGLQDPVGEKMLSPVPWVIRKYRDRALLLVTKRCHLYCRYCFRRTHNPGDALDPSGAQLDEALEYLANVDGLREVILSGGDPMILPDAKLFAIVDRVRSFGLRVRIHTRAPITFPERVTKAFASGLAERGVWVSVHCNHPRELSGEVDEALRLLRVAGVPLLNQAVLLAGVNDDAAVLVELFELLVQRGVRPYYLHHPDAVAGNAHFRVPMARGREIVARVRAEIGGVAMPRYVVDPPTGVGKHDVAPALPNTV